MAPLGQVSGNGALIAESDGGQEKLSQRPAAKMQRAIGDADQRPRRNAREIIVTGFCKNAAGAAPWDDAIIIDHYADTFGADDDAPMLPAWMTQRHDARAPKRLWNWPRVSIPEQFRPAQKCNARDQWRYSTARRRKTS
jgi:hypothetical protein